MELGMIGLGRMGAGLALRAARGGHRVVGFVRHVPAGDSLTDEGIELVFSLDALIARLPAPRVLWMMIPAGATVDGVIDDLKALLSPGDTLIDGGNSNYRDTLARAAMLDAAGIHYLDCGTSGGIRGLADGYCLMIGGDAAIVERLRPLFACLAPGPAQGWGRVGPSGAGHFTKMVHNGIEYGLMQAYAEGFALLQHKQTFALDLHQVAEIWRSGSVVRSWLLDLTAEALASNPGLDGIAPYVEDSGEGRWAVAEAIELDVSAPVITLALLERLRSRDDVSYSSRLLAAMRNQFGGHPIKPA